MIWKLTATFTVIVGKRKKNPIILSDVGIPTVGSMPCSHRKIFQGMEQNGAIYMYLFIALPTPNTHSSQTWYICRRNENLDDDIQ